MVRWLYLAAALVLVVGTTVIHGQWTDRWGRSTEQVRALIERLDRLPATVGDWTTDPQHADESNPATGQITRRYVGTDRRPLTVSLMAGRAGYVAAHTPDMCFIGGGYELAANPVQVAVPCGEDGKTAQFYVARFRKTSVDRVETVKVWWSWQDGRGEWKAPDNPRLAFASWPVLLKLYLIYPLPDSDNSSEEDPGPGFLKRFLPAVDGRGAHPQE
jgi:hypothetical protein